MKSCYLKKAHTKTAPVYAVHFIAPECVEVYLDLNSEF